LGLGDYRRKRAGTREAAEKKPLSGVKTSLDVKEQEIGKKCSIIDSSSETERRNTRERKRMFWERNERLGKNQWRAVEPELLEKENMNTEPGLLGIKDRQRQRHKLVWQTNLLGKETLERFSKKKNGGKSHMSLLDEKITG